MMIPKERLNALTAPVHLPIIKLPQYKDMNGEIDNSE